MKRNTLSVTSRFSRIFGYNTDTGQNLDTIPATTLALTLGGRLPQYDLSFGWRGKFAESIATGATTDGPFAGYAVHDLFADWTPEDGQMAGWQLRASVENIFDTSYRYNLAGDDGPGRNVQADAGEEAELVKPDTEGTALRGPFPLLQRKKPGQAPVYGCLTTTPSRYHPSKIASAFSAKAASLICASISCRSTFSGHVSRMAARNAASPSASCRSAPGRSHSPHPPTGRIRAVGPIALASCSQ